MSAAQRMSRHQNATWMVGRGLSLFAENKCQLKTGGLCTYPSPSVDQSQKSTSKLNVWWDPQGAPREEVKRLTTLGVASCGRRHVEATPGCGIVDVTPRYPRVGRPWRGRHSKRSRYGRGGLEPRYLKTVIKIRERWLQGHSPSTSRG